jgi:hypothetical protein
MLPSGITSGARHGVAVPDCSTPRSRLGRKEGLLCTWSVNEWEIRIFIFQFRCGRVFLTFPPKTNLTGRITSKLLKTKDERELRIKSRIQILHRLAFGPKFAADYVEDLFAPVVHYPPMEKVWVATLNASDCCRFCEA